jgi:hypothetical protein
MPPDNISDPARIRWQTAQKITIENLGYTVNNRSICTAYYGFYIFPFFVTLDPIGRNDRNRAIFKSTVVIIAVPFKTSLQTSPKTR